jgi:hypothetical protein
MGRNFFDLAMGASHPPLTDDQKRILDFGKRWFKTPADRFNAITEEFGMSETSYFQKLNSLRSHPEAASYAPDVINRANRVVELSKDPDGR